MCKNFLLWIRCVCQSKPDVGLQQRCTTEEGAVLSARGFAHTAVPWPKRGYEPLVGTTRHRVARQSNSPTRRAQQHKPILGLRAMDPFPKREALPSRANAATTCVVPGAEFTTTAANLASTRLALANTPVRCARLLADASLTCSFP